MNLSRSFRRSLLANLLLSLACFSIAESGLPVFLALGGLAAGGWWMSERGVRQPVVARGIPRWLANSLLLLAVAVAVARGWLERAPISAFLWLLASILILKIWERRRRRDYGQILTISVFLSIGATLSDQSLALGLALLVQLPVTVGAVVKYQMFLSSNRVEAPGAGPVLVPRLPLGLVLGSAVLLSSVLASLVFLFVPRGIGLHQLGDFQQPMVGRSTGFSDSVDLDVSGLISESQTPVMDLRVSDGNGLPLGGEDRTFYLRGAVLDTYSERNWTRNVSNGSDNPASYPLSAGSETSDLWSNSPIRTVPNPADVIVQRITLRSISRSQCPVFCVYAPRSVQLPSNVPPVGLNYYSSTSWMYFMGLSGARFEYIVRSTPNPPIQPGSPKVRTRTSFPSEVVRREAVRLLESAGLETDDELRSPEQDTRAARIFEAYLRTGFEYTLAPPAPPIKQDPIEWFLTDSKRGHCEFFASALAAMCRSVGIDARVIAGYMVNEFDPSTQTYVVRASNAHAWVEVNTAPGTWETMDATPPASLIDLRNQHGGLFGKISQFFAGLRDSWNMNVVTFDSSSQERLLGADTQETGIAAWIRHRTEEPPSLRTAGDLLLVGARVAIPVAAGLGLLAIARSWRSRRMAAAMVRRAGWALHRHHLPLLRAIEAALARRGRPRPDWQPLFRCLRDPAVADGPLGEALARGVEALYADRFGETPLSAAESARLAAAIKRAVRNG